MVFLSSGTSQLRAISAFEPLLANTLVASKSVLASIRESRAERRSDVTLVDIILADVSNVSGVAAVAMKPVDVIVTLTAMLTGR